MMHSITMPEKIQVGAITIEKHPAAKAAKKNIMIRKDSAGRSARFTMPKANKQHGRVRIINLFKSLVVSIWRPEAKKLLRT